MTAMNMNFEEARFNMVEQQIRPWDVLDPRVLDVLSRIPREDFVPEAYRAQAYVDTRIPLAEFGAVTYTMMNPNVEGRLLQNLVIGDDDIILEIGTGSGYLTACLAALGRNVDSVDINPEMTEMAEANLAALGVGNINLSTDDAAPGWKLKQFYDAIAITCSLPEAPMVYKNMLKEGGRLFVITGAEPAMQARLITRLGKDDWSDQVLFETCIEPMANVRAPNTFVF
jgi:protein-L-isoaspartate(D-aspartate) O-methyltransferase